MQNAPFGPSMKVKGQGRHWVERLTHHRAIKEATIDEPWHVISNNVVYSYEPVQPPVSYVMAQM